MALPFLSGLIGAIITIIFGILILVFPKTLAYLVGIYLILIGIIGVIGII